MKKLIAILTIAIVLVGAVFADDNAAVKITVNVGEYVPTFKLTTNDATNIADDVEDDVAANGAGTPASVTLNDTAKGTLSEGSELTVSFGIVQVNNAEGYIKTTHSYSFTVSAQSLNLKVSGTRLADNSATANQKFTVKTISEIEATNNAPADTYAEVTDGAAANSHTFTIDYNGTKYIPSDDELMVAAFDVTWNANEAALPGDYEATVTLTMTTV